MAELKANIEAENDIEIEVEDDTPSEDRGREPMPKELVKELEDDELEEYSDKVKTRLKQMKKVWHDERREKERILREQQAALEIAQNMQNELINERKKLHSEKLKSFQFATQAAEASLKRAELEYKDAYETGDSDRLLVAQKQLQEASGKLNQLKGYKSRLDRESKSIAKSANPVVNSVQPQPQQVQLDPKTDSWRRQNTWFGSDDEMTAAAIGLNNKLIRERGKDFEGSEEYWEIVDKTMRKRFPEHDWGDEPDERQETRSTPTRTERPATVVAPVSRSTASNKVKLKQSQLNVIKKMGITPEQYVREMMKLERANG